MQAMLATLSLNANHETVAEWIYDLTMQIEQSHRQDQYVPDTPGPQANWDYEMNRYTGLVRVQIGITRPEELDSDPRCREDVFEDQEIIRFELHQLRPDTASLRIIYFEEREDQFAPYMLDYLREYLCEIAEVWPESRERLEQQLSGFDELGIFAERQLAEPASAGTEHQPVWERIPDHGYDRKMLELWCEGYTAREISAMISMGGSPTAKTITNRLSLLRQTHGEELVPYHRRK